MYLLVGFSPQLWIKTISKIFVTDFSDFLMKFWEISKKCSNFVNFWARKMFFFLKQVRISPEKDWCSHQYPYGGILPQVAAVFVNFYVSTDMIAWWVSVHCRVNLELSRYGKPDTFLISTFLLPIICIVITFHKNQCKTIASISQFVRHTASVVKHCNSSVVLQQTCPLNDKERTTG